MLLHSIVYDLPEPVVGFLFFSICVSVVLKDLNYLMKELLGYVYIKVTFGFVCGIMNAANEDHSDACSFLRFGRKVVNG